MVTVRPSQSTSDLLLRSTDTAVVMVTGNGLKDPDTARKLLPNYLIGTKRQILDEGYYDTFNRDNVRLIDIRRHPIERITATGIQSGTAPDSLMSCRLCSICAAR